MTSAHIATGEQVLGEIADLIQERLPSVPQDDPYVGVLQALRSAAPRRPQPREITLTHTEAAAVRGEMWRTEGHFMLDPPQSRVETERFVRRLQVERVLLDDLVERLGYYCGPPDPDAEDNHEWLEARRQGLEFPLSSDASAALVELLPGFVAQAEDTIRPDPSDDEDQRARNDEFWRPRYDALVRLAERLDVEIPQGLRPAD